jgi:hypothetical protein
MTPKNAPWIYTNTILYHSHMFQHHLNYAQGAVHQDVKLSKM